MWFNTIQNQVDLNIFLPYLPSFYTFTSIAIDCIENSRKGFIKKSVNYYGKFLPLANILVKLKVAQPQIN